jgi:hypothetical protein
MLGFFMHCVYVIVINVYVSLCYLKENEDEDQARIYVILLAVGIFYPWLYDFMQMARALTDYFTDPWNYADMIYTYGSIANCVIQIVYGPFHQASRILMCIIILLLLVKTFFFLRIFATLTPLVVMLTSVFGDLRPFMLFYTILIIMLGQLYCILGLGNVMHKDTKFSSQYKDKYEKTLQTGEISHISGMPGVEYYHVGLHIGEILWTLRISIGDNSAIGPATVLDPVENIIFWVCFFITVFASNIVFLNFIVAEASNTYAKVTETLEATIWMERSSLIAEAEEMTWRDFKTLDKFPKYLIVREVEK